MFVFISIFISILLIVAVATAIVSRPRSHSSSEVAPKPSPGGPYRTIPELVDFVVAQRKKKAATKKAPPEPPKPEYHVISPTDPDMVLYYDLMDEWRKQTRNLNFGGALLIREQANRIYEQLVANEMSRFNCGRNQIRWHRHRPGDAAPKKSPSPPKKKHKNHLRLVKK